MLNFADYILQIIAILTDSRTDTIFLKSNPLKHSARAEVEVVGQSTASPSSFAVFPGFG